MAICRICKEYDKHSNLVKYGTRHYAHSRCYLAVKNAEQVSKLPKYVLGQFKLKDINELGYRDLFESLI